MCKQNKKRDEIWSGVVLVTSEDCSMQGTPPMVSSTCENCLKFSRASPTLVSVWGLETSGVRL